MNPLRRGWLDTLAGVVDVVRRVDGPRELLRMALPDDRLRRIVLNAGGGDSAAGAAAATADLGADLRKLLNRLKAEAIDDRGHVRYAALRASPTYAALAETSRALVHAEPGRLTDPERTAFWINLYNVLTVHGVIALGIRASVMERPTFFRTVTYRVGAYAVTLDDIEHGILRRNAVNPTTRRPCFAAPDARCDWAPARLDPRLHCALVCAGASCPPVSFYDAARIDAQLDAAAANFVAHAVRVDDRARTLRLSAIFSWYEADFAAGGGVAGFLLRHSTGAQRDAIARAIDAGYAWRVDRYDWSLNAA